MKIAMRVFPSAALAKAYAPAARVESMIRGYDRTIMTGTDDECEEYWRTWSP
jgi:hypothetical protein